MIAEVERLPRAVQTQTAALARFGMVVQMSDEKHALGLSGPGRASDTTDELY